MRSKIQHIVRICAEKGSWIAPLYWGPSGNLGAPGRALWGGWSVTWATRLSVSAVSPCARVASPRPAQPAPAAAYQTPARASTEGTTHTQHSEASHAFDENDVEFYIPMILIIRTGAKPKQTESWIYGNMNVFTSSPAGPKQPDSHRSS